MSKQLSILQTPKMNPIKNDEIEKMLHLIKILIAQKIQIIDESNKLSVR